MEYRSLGRTGVKVSELCLGCWMFGRRTEAEDAYAMVDQAIEAGVNFMDTANAYSRGKSEEMLGEALKRNEKRSRVVLATKVFGNMDDEDPNGRGNSRRHIIEQCEASLRRLQTDYIDLYQIHFPMPDSVKPIFLSGKSFDVLEALEPIAKEKKCSMSQLALAWVGNQPGVTSPIIGPRTMEQLVDNLGSVDVEITDDDRARIDAIVPPGSMLIPYPQVRTGKIQIGKPHPHRW